jgi:hypothetical protein
MLGHASIKVALVVFVVTTSGLNMGLLALWRSEPATCA